MPEPYSRPDVRHLGAAGLVIVFGATIAGAQPPPPPPVQAPARDATEVRLVATGTASISGIVQVMGAGQPARRARVSLSGEEVRSGTSTTTDDQGRFSFTRLPAGRYNLSVTKPGHVTALFGQRRPGSQGTPIQLADGQRFEARLQIPKGGVLTGIVLDEMGEATPGTPVRAMRWVTQNGRRTLQSSGNSSTDDRGMYRIYGLQPGEYVVCATPRNPGGGEFVDIQGLRQQVEVMALPPGGAPQAIAQERLAAVEATFNAREDSAAGYAPVCYPGSTNVAEASPIPLGISEERPGVDFQLQMVPLARVEGSVLNPTGGPLQNVQVTLADLQGRAPLGVSSTARVDGEGRFRLNGVAPGQYRLSARMQIGGGRGAAPAAGRGGAPGQRPDTSVYWAVADIVVDGRGVSNVMLPLQPGMTASGQITFEGGATPPTDLTRLRINVNPVDGGSAFGGPSFANADATGRFTVANLAPGLYRASVSGAQGWSAESAVVGGVDALDFPFEVKGGQNISGLAITMIDQQTEIAGYLVDTQTQPAIDYTVVVFPSDSRLWTGTSRRVQMARPATDGRFFIRNLAAGDYRIVPVLDVPTGALSDPNFLQQLETSAQRITLQRGEKKVQDVRVGGG